jgi:cell pole-organizing protein PopZ
MASKQEKALRFNNLFGLGKVIMAEQPRKGQDEPSIEEILGSIRRIIAEDDDASTVAPDAPEVSAAAADQPDPMEEEPLELTNKIDPDGTILDAAAEETTVAFAEDEKPTPPPAPEPEPVFTPPPVKEQPKMADEILSNVAADAAAASLAKLARHTPIAEEGHDGISVESIVREMLRPMLKEWMDKNLPDLVQKMVERELEKLSKRV